MGILNNCKFCGGEAEILKGSTGVFGGVAYQIKCSRCGASTFPRHTGIYLNQKHYDDIDAINYLLDKWNKEASE